MTTTPTPPDDDRLIYGGLLALAVTGTFALIEAFQSVSWPLMVASYAFAVSTPLLAGCFIAEMARRHQARPRTASTLRQLVSILAALTAVVGLSALFFHLGIVQGIVFVAAIVVAIVLVRTI